MNNNWASYWKNRWLNKDTGWHQEDPEPGMVSFFSGISSKRVFVPLCGKSKDLLWLVQHGHQVVGVELSELACQSFFEENNLPFSKIVQKGYLQFEGNQITLFNQDIFAFTPNLLGRIDAVYDRAALIALPSEMRVRYSKHLISLISSCSDMNLIEFCQIALERIPGDTNGPPFSVTEKEIRLLYGNFFNIELVSCELISEEKNSKMLEYVYKLKGINKIS